MSPGPGATVGAAAGVLGFIWTRGLREGTGEMWRFSESENQQDQASTCCLRVSVKSLFVSK